MNATYFDDRPDAAYELAEAARLFASADDRRDLQLEAVLHSVGAALRLLREKHEWSQLVPLQYLFAGLSRLASGRPDPVLKPLRKHKKPGKSPAPDAAMIFKQVIILCAHEVLRRGGWRKIAADRRVAELATAAGLTSLEGQPISQHMVRNWRSLVDTREMQPVMEGLKACTSILHDKLDPASVEEAAAQMLKQSASNFAGIEISRDPTLL